MNDLINPPIAPYKDEYLTDARQARGTSSANRNDSYILPPIERGTPGSKLQRQSYEL